MSYELSSTKTKAVKKQILAIDLDGVIHDVNNPVENRRMGAPFDDAQAAMKRLSHHFVLIIYSVKATTPEGAQVVEDWCKYYHIPYDGITAVKPDAVLFIDDKAYRHTDWTTTLAYIKETL